MRLRFDAAHVLPAVIAIACLVLIVAEFMDAFEFVSSGEIQRVQTNMDRHSFAFGVIAIGALIALAVHLRDGSRPAAVAIAALGGVALLVFLIGDLPDAGKVGDFEDPLRGFVNAEAEAQPGFWLTAIGSVTLAMAGGLLVSLPRRTGSSGA